MVVVRLEKIDVEHDHGQRLALAHGTMPGIAKPFVKVFAVGDAEQAIGLGKYRQLAVRLLQCLIGQAQLGRACGNALFQLAVGRREFDAQPGHHLIEIAQGLDHGLGGRIAWPGQFAGIRIRRRHPSLNGLDLSRQRLIDTEYVRT